VVAIRRAVGIDGLVFGLIGIGKVVGLAQKPRATEYFSRCEIKMHDDPLAGIPIATRRREG
jgi:hypothetical protein